MKRLKDLFENHAKESERLESALLAHRATHAAMLAKFNAADDLCIAAAAKLNALVAAGSPRAAEAHTELKTLRWDRDRIKADWGRAELAITAKMEALTHPLIEDFTAKCLSELRGLGSQRTVRVVDEWFTTVGVKMVKIETNVDALNEKKKLLLAASCEIRDMRHRSIPVIKKAIADFDARLADIDTDLVVVETTHDHASDLRPHEDGGPAATGFALPGGGIVLAGGVTDSITAHEHLMLDSAIAAKDAKAVLARK